MATILDTGPLVALLNRSDRWHHWAARQFALTIPPFISCEPVITEAMHLLRRFPPGPGAVISMLERGVIRLPHRLADHCGELARLLTKYADVPMSLADAFLVRISELTDEPTVLTLDTDFTVYRRHGRRRIPVVMPRSE